ncbi:MAG: leucine-rich repeat domain-containing protein [Anaerolineae bacterium]|nr:leucine-rich repeat domain-containing protein [Anaerolineae bacterium]
MLRSFRVKLFVVALLVGLLLSSGKSMSLRAAPSAYDCATATGLPQAECEALVALYNATDGDHWANRSNWLETSTPCGWFGVECRNEHVTELALGCNGLQGFLPPEIDAFTQLTRLNLRESGLSALPAEIGDLSALKWLDLSYNALSVLPAEFGNLTVKFLNLENNAFTDFPLVVTDLPALETLYLGNNALTSLPAEIDGLSTLSILWMQNNALASLPAEFGNLQLLTLDLSGNALTSLPAEFGNLTSLIHLRLSGNALTALPSGFGNLTELMDLDLSDNALTSLPPGIGNLTQLAWIFLNGNALTTLPEEIGALAPMDYLYLHDNPLSGEMPAFLTSLVNLKVFSFYGTEWCVPATGAVPLWLADIGVANGTGLICGEDPGVITGTVTMPGHAPVADMQVNLYRQVEDDKWYRADSTQTGATGVYAFDGLGQGIGYRVQFVDPTHQYLAVYYGSQRDIEQAIPVTVALGSVRAGIDVVVTPVAVSVIKSATSPITIPNGSILVSTLVISANVDSLHLYDPLGEHMTWLGFVGDVPETLMYVDNVISGTVTLSESSPLVLSFAVRVNVPEASFVGEYAQVSNTAYYYYEWETLAMMQASNTLLRVVHNRPASLVFLPLVMRNP